MAAGLLALLAALFWAGRSGNPDTGACVPGKGHWSYGIDLSRHNAGPIVWDSLAVLIDRQGRTVRSLASAREIYPIDYIVLKATEGVSLQDRTFAERWEAAGRTRLRRGAYHFFRSSRNAREQAMNYILTVGNLRHTDLPPVLDVETIHPGCSREAFNQRVREWLDVVEKHYGRTPILYTGASFAREHLDRDILDSHPVWIAHYEKETPAYSGWDYWQFTDRGVVYGVKGLVDINVRPLNP